MPSETVTEVVPAEFAAALRKIAECMRAHPARDAARALNVLGVVGFIYDDEKLNGERCTSFGIPIREGGSGGLADHVEALAMMAYTCKSMVAELTELYVEAAPAPFAEAVAEQKRVAAMTCFAEMLALFERHHSKWEGETKIRRRS